MGDSATSTSPYTSPQMLILSSENIKNPFFFFVRFKTLPGVGGALFHRGGAYAVSWEDSWWAQPSLVQTFTV